MDGSHYNAGGTLGNTPSVENGKQAAGDAKAPLCLIEPVAKRQIAEVMQVGAVKYGARNYLRSPMRKSTYYSAMQRHLDAWYEGEECDPETGMRHLAHVGANVNILLAVGDAIIDDAAEPNVKPSQRITDALNQAGVTPYVHPDNRPAEADSHRLLGQDITPELTGSESFTAETQRMADEQFIARVNARTFPCAGCPAPYTCRHLGGCSDGRAGFFS